MNAPHPFMPDPTGTACGLCGGWPDDLAHVPRYYFQFNAILRQWIQYPARTSDDVEFVKWKDVSARLQQLDTAMLLKDRTRRAIRERAKAGEAHASLATDYGVPESFIAALCAFQLGADEPVTSESHTQTAGHSDVTLNSLHYREEESQRRARGEIPLWLENACRVQQLAQEKEHWRVECERLATGLADTFEEQVCDEDGNLPPEKAVDAAFAMFDNIDDSEKRAKTAERALAETREALHQLQEKYESLVESQRESLTRGDGL